MSTTTFFINNAILDANPSPTNNPSTKTAGKHATSQHIAYKRIADRHATSLSNGEEVYKFLMREADCLAVLLAHLDPPSRVSFALASKRCAQLSFSLLKGPDDWDLEEAQRADLMEVLEHEGFFGDLSWCIPCGKYAAQTSDLGDWCDDCVENDSLYGRSHYGCDEDEEEEEEDEVGSWCGHSLHSVDNEDEGEGEDETEITIPDVVDEEEDATNRKA